MDCYGRSYGRRDDCKRCKLSKYCRDAGDPPLFSQLSDADPDKRVTAVTAVDEIAVLPPEPEPEMMYSRAELLEVISFMVHLDERTLDFLEAKLTGADFCLSHLAQERKVSRQAVHKLLKDRLRRFPEFMSGSGGKYLLEAEVYGDGIKMWLLSQGGWVKVISPQDFVQEMKDEIERMRKHY